MGENNGNLETDLVTPILQDPLVLADCMVDQGEGQCRIGNISHRNKSCLIITGEMGHIETICFL